MRLHVTLREEPLYGSDLQVVVRCGVWNNDRIRGTFPNSTREAYEELLEQHPELRARLAARFGTEFAVVSVFARPGEAGLLPNAVGTDDLRHWLATHDPVSKYGKYREAVIASLRLAGYEVLPTDTVLISDTGERHSEAAGDHYDIVVADLSDEVLDELLSHFSEEIINSARSKPDKAPAPGLLPDADKGTLRAERRCPMRHLQVDFNNLVGSGVLPVPTHGQAFTTGEHVAVSDEGTDVYEAVVLGTSGDTVFLEVSDKVLAEA